MEYRCIIVGDPVVEPYALLRRVLYDPFSDAEEYNLRHESLLAVRSSEARNERIPTHVAPPPGVPGSWTLSMSNPSMPSVDISIRFSVVTDPQRLLQVTSQGYHGKLTPAGLCDPEAADGDNGGVAGFPLHQPHCVVVCFNPFSLRSFLRMRAEWTHFLDFTRQQQHASSNVSGKASSSASGAFDPMAIQLPGKQTKGLLSGFFFNEGPPSPSSGDRLPGGGLPLTPHHRLAYETSASPQREPSGGRASGPTVIFVATRLELMRQAIESTPTIEVPTPSDVAETAQWIQARAYAEVNTNLEDTVDTLRHYIARACVGDLADAPVVGYDSVNKERSESVWRAMEDIHTNPDGDPISSSDDSGTPMAQTHAMPRQFSPSADKTDDEASSDEEHRATQTPVDDAPRHAARESFNNFCEHTGNPGKALPRPKHARSRWTYRRHAQTGRVFYVNRLTRRSQYGRPSDYDGREPSPPLSPEPSEKLSDSASAGGQSGSTEAPAPALSSSSDSDDGRDGGALPRVVGVDDDEKSTSSHTSGDDEGKEQRHRRRRGKSDRPEHSMNSSTTVSANDADSHGDVSTTIRPPEASHSLSSASSTASQQGAASSASSASSPSSSSSPPSPQRRQSRKASAASASRAIKKHRCKGRDTDSGDGGADTHDTETSLVSLTDVDYGEDVWDADHVLQEMRKDQRRLWQARLEEEERSLEQLKEQKRHLVSRQKTNETRAAHLRAMRDEVEEKERQVRQQAAEDEAALEEELARLSFAMRAHTEYIPADEDDGATSSRSLSHTGPGSGGQRDGAEPAVPVPRSEELATYGTNLDAAEEELGELIAHLEDRQRQFWALRSEVQRAQVEYEAVAGQLSALAAYSAELDSDEAALRRELGEVEARLLTVRERMITRELLRRGQGREDGRPQDEGNASTSADARPSQGPLATRNEGEASWDMDDYVRNLMGLWGEVESVQNALAAEEGKLGPSVLSRRDERERLSLSCMARVRAVVLHLVAAAGHIYKAVQARESVAALLLRLDAARTRQRSLLEEEEERAARLLWNGREGREKKVEEGSGSAEGRLAAGLDAHLTQLRELRHRFDAEEENAMARLRQRCALEVGRVTEAVAHLGSGANDTADDRATARVLWAWLNRCIEELSGDPDAPGAAATRPTVRAWMHGALRKAVTYGPSAADGGAAIDHNFLSSLQRCLDDCGGAVGTSGGRHAP